MRSVLPITAASISRAPSDYFFPSGLIGTMGGGVEGDNKITVEHYTPQCSRSERRNARCRWRRPLGQCSRTIDQSSSESLEIVNLQQE